MAEEKQVKYFTNKKTESKTIIFIGEKNILCYFIFPIYKLGRSMHIYMEMFNNVFKFVSLSALICTCKIWMLTWKKVARG